MPPTPLDEKALRRPGFTEGHAIRLADGQEWTFPKPWLKLFPGRDEKGEVETYSRVTYGRDYERLVDELVEIDSAEDSVAWITHKFEMAATLLSRNYDLAEDDLFGLLALEPGNPESEDAFAELGRVLQGIAPKRSADGSV